MMKVLDLPTPAVVIDIDAMEKNLRLMQSRCSETGVGLWPHCKTHKLVPVLRRQLELGAGGATVAKIGEAEALLPSGVRNIFIAHSIVRLDAAPRLRDLREKLDRLVLAVTSEAQLAALEKVIEAAGIEVEMMLGVDAGLGREGARTPESAARLAERIRDCPRMKLTGIYSHEGNSYRRDEPDLEAFANGVHTRLMEYRSAIGGDLPLWPGCSVTALLMAGKEAVKVVRPGAYVFGDLSLCESDPILPWDQAALSIIATVIDLPDEHLALIDAGSKVFSSDRSLAGLCGRERDRRHLTVTKLSEEHGFVTWTEGAGPAVGDVLRIIPAHVCTVVNLRSEIYVAQGDEIVETWKVDARGCSV